MVKRVCDRCGAEVALEESVSCAAGHIIIKTESGDINKDWHCLDLCEGCRKSFAEWLGTCTDKDAPNEKQCPHYVDSHSCYWCVLKNTENCQKQEQAEAIK